MRKAGGSGFLLPLRMEVGRGFLGLLRFRLPVFCGGGSEDWAGFPFCCCCGRRCFGLLCFGSRLALRFCGFDACGAAAQGNGFGVGGEGFAVAHGLGGGIQKCVLVGVPELAADFVAVKGFLAHVVGDNGQQHQQRDDDNGEKDVHKSARSVGFRFGLRCSKRRANNYALR